MMKTETIEKLVLGKHEEVTATRMRDTAMFSRPKLACLAGWSLHHRLALVQSKERPPISHWCAPKWRLGVHQRHLVSPPSLFCDRSNLPMLSFEPLVGAQSANLEHMNLLHSIQVAAG